MMNNKLYLSIIGVIILLISLISIIRADCPLPRKKLANGRIIYQTKLDSNITSVPENYRLRFRCNHGYTLRGSQTIFCFSNEWTDTKPSCLKMTCGAPTSIENGSYKINSGTTNLPTFGSTVEYFCDEGFEMVNSTTSILTCSLSSQKNSAVWEGDIPGCKEKESCPDPGVSADGERIANSFFVGSVLEYSCNDEFEIVGKDRIECLPGGRWSSPRPLCRPLSDYCELPPGIPHGVPKGEKEGDYYRPYDEIEIICELGYSYKGVSQFIMCEEEGQWEEEFGECTEVYCDFPPPLENGKIPEIETINATTLPFNFEVTYICDKGYRLIGDSWRFCDARGWSGSEPHCEVIHCPDPGVPKQGTRILDGLKIGDKVIFKCFTGYDLIGSFERYCMPNGQWSGELARCDNENNYCPDPGIPINGMKNSTNYDMGERICFSCQSGYTLLGTEVRECLPHRIWSGNEAKCVGPYDFDNTARVSDILMTAIAEKEEEQKRKTKEYRKVLYSSWHNGTVLPLGRVLDLNFPGRIILYFAFDVSGSVGQHNFQKSIEFAKAIVKRIGISEIGARAGALTFSSKAETQFLPLEYKTTEQVLDALDKVDYTGGGTSASSALALIREELIPLTQAVLSKRGQKSVIFILTDGKANMGGDPQQEAELLKRAGVEIYCIGITSTVLQDSLYKIASENEAGSKEEYVFILQNYATMDWLIQRITNGTIDYSQCGVGLEKLGKQTGRGRIVGGRRAPEPWPWMAALYFTEQGFQSELQCGGSIIHEKLILTAAHCLFTKKGERRKDKEIIIKLGLTNVTNETNVQEYEVKKFFIHPQYRLGLIYDYDIALLQLKRPIEFNAFIRPICLPPAEPSPNSTLYKAGQYTVATGWGHSGVVEKMERVNTKSVQSLKEIILPIQSRERCLQSAVENLVDKIPADKVFTDRMFCVGDGNGGNDTCSGDSGGPLMQSQQNSEGNIYWTQIGIVSWGIGCGLPNTYGYYTHVQNLNFWIANITSTS
ncbi:complement factor B-like [Parasteatoda tepidariorum]|uniref:complement factor B-like n=1 Tax=Parasteatoda tepidariorum TaxID=114398 RepID=UPI00077FBCDC|nr:complement factor B-like [Parasteatoda tepidariorum]